MRPRSGPAQGHDGQGDLNGEFRAGCRQQGTTLCRFWGLWRCRLKVGPDASLGYGCSMAKRTKLKRVDYSERSDVRKIHSQWTKLTGLHERNEPSAAIVRAATAAELAVNLAIRREFAAQSELSAQSIDAMLKKANGLWGKMAGLLLPLVIGGQNEAAIKRLCKLSERINKNRNDIVHSGHFSNRADALKIIHECRKFVNGLVVLYEGDFKLQSLSADAIEEQSQDEAAGVVSALKPNAKKLTKNMV